MLKQTYLLSSKIKVAGENNRPDIIETHPGFYSHYSRFTLSALRKTSFQEFIFWMLSSEKIEENSVNSVYIQIYPAAKKSGLNVVGRCNTSKGRIRIYPKSFYFCKDLRKNLGRKVLFAFVGNRARAALIHELLHLKYSNDEKKVRELTDLYFCAYMKKKQLDKDSALLRSLIFSTKKVDALGFTKK
jgi:hypothetical protein